jgi:hypothetical protein
LPADIGGASHAVRTTSGDRGAIPQLTPRTAGLIQKSVIADDEGTGPQLKKGRKRRVNIAFAADVPDLQPHSWTSIAGLSSESIRRSCAMPLRSRRTGERTRSPTPSRTALACRSAIALTGLVVLFASALCSAGSGTSSKPQNLAASVGDPGSIVPPRSASRAFMFGSTRAALISLFSLSMISAGVFLGAPMPYH